MNVPIPQTPPTPRAKFYLFTPAGYKLRCLLHDYYSSVFNLVRLLLGLQLVLAYYGYYFALVLALLLVLVI